MWVSLKWPWLGRANTEKKNLLSYWTIYIILSLICKNKMLILFPTNRLLRLIRWKNIKGIITIRTLSVLFFYWCCFILVSVVSLMHLFFCLRRYNINYVYCTFLNSTQLNSIQSNPIQSNSIQFNPIPFTSIQYIINYKQ